MIIKLSPVRSDAELSISKSGDALTINGTVFDFTQLSEGDVLPREAVGSDWVAADVTRVGGLVELTVMLPHGADASEAARFPQPLYVTKDGLVELPK